jgi:hypothetical protein
MKSSLHRLIPFLPFLLNHLQLPSTELGPVLILAACDLRCIASRRTHRKHRFQYCCEGAFTAPLHCNGSYSIVACLFVFAGMCFPSRCRATHMRITIWNSIVNIPTHTHTHIHTHHLTRLKRLGTSFFNI